MKKDLVVLGLAGAVFCWFSYGGLSDLMPLRWAIPLAFLVTSLYAMACHQAGRAKGWVRAGFCGLALIMWVSVTLADGLSFNEIISHEGGDRVRTSRTAELRPAGPVIIARQHRKRARKTGRPGIRATERIGIR